MCACTDSPCQNIPFQIVLSSEDEDRDRAQRRSRRRTKDLTTNRVDHSEASSSSQDTIAANGISWLNPANAGVHPTAFVPYSSSNSSEQSNTPQNGSVEHRPFGSYFVPSSSSPQPLSDLPSTSKQEPYSATPESGRSSHDPKNDQKRPKSLFQPSPAKIYTPIEGTEVRAENKLLARLFQERQLRNSQRKGSDSVQGTPKDEMDVSSMNDSVFADTAENKLLARLFQERQLRNSQRKGSDSVQGTPKDEMDVSSMNDSVFADTASTSSTGQLQGENNKDTTMQLDASNGDAATMSKLMLCYLRAVGYDSLIFLDER
ncbi:hypothetical protein OESDEN_13324 [Oesophagostomum dentatum]|uniref:Uncharacterized protein n=1 Tax=Oesophagostomum dentatum TaxID=61180 RepID=A0A0B1STQ1_OESDE|nr:hypothetical protein OESDEN_13324 [Oesophagostomum dentatum]